MFLLLISKPAFYRWLNFAISWRPYNPEMDSHNTTFFFTASLLRRERRDDEGLYAPAVPDLHTDLL